MAARELRDAVQRLMAVLRKPEVEVTVQRRDIELLLMVKATYNGLVRTPTNDGL